MAVPLAYNFRNLWTRRLTTVLTVFGMALVVFVFASVLMLADGLQKTLVETGSYDNGVFLRKGSASEVMSGVTREQASIIETLPEITIGPQGRRLVAKELVVLVALPKRGTDKPSNVVLRGIEENSFRLRSQVRPVEGRLPRMGSTEIIVGESIARRFKGIAVNKTLYYGTRYWQIVGIFEAGNTGFSSEIWGDADQFMQAFRRSYYSSVIVRMRDSSEFQTIKSRIENDPRLTLQFKRESKYYAEQSEIMARFLRILGWSLTIIFSIGAMIGAMITMYSAVANRMAEIGTLRALGFGRRDVLIAFLLESLLLGFLGGLVGLFFASFMQLITISTMNFQTFSELAFSFTLNFEIIYRGMVFALIMGLIGGVLPAIRASRMMIVDALRAI